MEHLREAGAVHRDGDGIVLLAGETVERDPPVTVGEIEPSISAWQWSDATVARTGPA